MLVNISAGVPGMGSERLKLSNFNSFWLLLGTFYLILLV